jgi:hypothetical protein
MYKSGVNSIGFSVGGQDIVNMDTAGLNIINGSGTANAWTTYSDTRIKSEKVDISYGLNDIMKLKPLKYFQHNRSTDEKGNIIITNGGNYTIGLIAQDLKQVIPEAVYTPEDENKNLFSIDYPKLIPVLIKGYQELNIEFNRYKEENKELHNKIEIIQAEHIQAIEKIQNLENKLKMS